MWLITISVSSLVTLMKGHEEGHGVTFAQCAREEIATLRKQLDKPKEPEDIIGTQTTAIHELRPALGRVPGVVSPDELDYWFGRSSHLFNQF